MALVSIEKVSFFIGQSLVFLCDVKLTLFIYFFVYNRETNQYLYVHFTLLNTCQNYLHTYFGLDFF